MGCEKSCVDDFVKNCCWLCVILVFLSFCCLCFAGLFIKIKKKSFGHQGSVLKDWDEMRHDSLCWAGLHSWTIFGH